MKRFGTFLAVTLSALLFGGSFAAFQYRSVWESMRKELARENYPAVLTEAANLRNSFLLLPLRWGTPFFLRNTAAEISFLEAEAWYKLGEKHRAGQAYVKAAELYTDGEKEKRAHAYYNGATVALDLEKYLEARDLLHKALDPGRGNPHHAYAKASLELLELLAASDKSVEERMSGGGLRFEEREPADPWSEQRPKDAQKRRARR